MTRHRAARLAIRSVPLVGAVALAGLASCKTPAPLLRIALAASSGQACPSTNCSEVPLSCDAVMSIRISDPEDTDSPLIDQCVHIPFDADHTMCSLSGVDLDATALPVRTLEVQIAVYPASEIPKDPGAPGGLRCPTSIKYSSATGYPVEQWPTPALGGRTFYHPGDSTVLVTLGCTDLALLEQSCAHPQAFRVAATVDDFENLFPVPAGGAATQLRVSVGEPRLIDGEYVMSGDDSRALPPVREGRTIATWGDDIDLLFDRYVCVEVFETIAQTTGALRCSEMTPATHLDDLRGVRISKDTLQKILGAITLAIPSDSDAPIAFPDEGLTIGIVADQASNPIEGMIVSSAGASTIRYLSKDGTLIDGMTSRTGIFVSSNALFGTRFSTSGGPGGRQEISGIGGRVTGRVTVVILQYGGQPL